MNSNLKSISRSVSSGFKSVESHASALATDKNVLYIMLVIAVVNIVGYLVMGNFEAVLFFAIVAYLSTFFTKNMVIVFLISILATNFLMVSKVNYFSRNHLTTKEGYKAPPQKRNVVQNAVIAGAVSNSMAKKPAAPTAPTAAPTAAPTTKPPAAVPKPTQSHSKKTSGEKKKEGMNGKLAPARFNDDSEDEDGVVEHSSAPFPSTEAQKNTQMERAYDTLQNIGSSAGGAMKMQTEEVMKQQKILMDNIKTMQPFLETAERFLDKSNMKGIDRLLGKIGMGGAPATAAPSTAP